jgi:hypothetical protein
MAASNAPTWCASSESWVWSKQLPKLVVISMYLWNVLISNGQLRWWSKIILFYFFDTSEQNLLIRGVRFSGLKPGPQMLASSNSFHIIACPILSEYLGEYSVAYRLWHIFR